MAAQVLSFFQRAPRYAPGPSDWSQQELAEFYRVEAALIRAGIRVGTDRGLSDENEPWFVFYRTDDGEVVIHFARIDGEYLIAGPAYEEIARGFDFTSMVRNMVARHPMIRRSERGDNIAVHPAALLVAVVGTAFFKTGEARAAETGAANPAAHARPVLLSSSSSASLTGGSAAAVAIAATATQPAYDTVQLPANQAVLVLAAALLASDFSVDAASLGVGAQSALASTAASLDFSGPLSPTANMGEIDVAMAPNHASAVANTPVQTVSSVLSLVALLSTLPHSADLAAIPETVQALSDGMRHEINFSQPLPTSSHDSANWSLEVRLGDGALPNVEAVQLVRAVLGDAAAQKITVIEVSKLPDVLAEIISRGEHVQVQPMTTQPAAPVGEPVTTPATNESLGSSGGEAVTAPPASAHPQTSAPAALVIPANLVTQFIDYFIAHTDHMAIVMQGAQVVIYDTRVMSDPGSIDGLTSMTFELPDHTSINLVGGQTSFLHHDFSV